MYGQDNSDLKEQKTNEQTHQKNILLCLCMFSFRSLDLSGDMSEIFFFFVGVIFLFVCFFFAKLFTCFRLFPEGSRAFTLFQNERVSLKR